MEERNRIQDPSFPKTNAVELVDANIVKIVQKYIRQCRLRLPEFRQAAEQKDFLFLVQEAHKIKGTGGLMSVGQLIRFGEQLELAARANNLSEIQQQLEALSYYLNTVTIAAKR
jgi:HPt (histidine-containing phosphotransfer) domain-containing protein